MPFSPANTGWSVLPARAGRTERLVMTHAALDLFPLDTGQQGRASPIKVDVSRTLAARDPTPDVSLPTRDVAAATSTPTAMMIRFHIMPFFSGLARVARRWPGAAPLAAALVLVVTTHGSQHNHLALALRCVPPEVMSTASGTDECSVGLHALASASTLAILVASPSSVACCCLWVSIADAKPLPISIRTSSGRRSSGSPTGPSGGLSERSG